MASAMGATVHLHYCMGEFMDVSLIHKEEHKCGKCGMLKTEKDNGCCKDEHKTLKAAEHNPAKFVFDLAYAQPAIVPVQLTYHCVPFRLTSFSDKKTGLANAPPGLRWPCPIYIYVSNFRI
jgi:hypothetical protein